MKPFLNCKKRKWRFSFDSSVYSHCEKGQIDIQIFKFEFKNIILFFYFISKYLCSKCSSDVYFRLSQNIYLSIHLSLSLCLSICFSLCIPLSISTLSSSLSSNDSSFIRKFRSSRMFIMRSCETMYVSFWANNFK